MHRLSLCGGWQYSPCYSEEIFRPDWSGEEVRLPHTNTVLPYNCFDDGNYQFVSGYKNCFFAEESWRSGRVFVTFEGAAHRATVFCNGTELYTHPCGYTAFTVELTDHLRYGESNDLVVRLDSRESLDQPPFGFVIDYMTYGGLYREAYLEVGGRCILSDVFITASPGGQLRSAVTLNGAVPEGCLLRQTVINSVGNEIADESYPVTDCSPETTLSVTGAQDWSCDNPVLYTLRTELVRGDVVLDSRTDRFGFRTAEFRPGGFYINGQPLKLRGLNRHQSYPYVGYAMPASMQRLDADILKTELGCNAVRTSHYPQSRHFIDRCDELGLLVFTEIPGWQHIGGEAWKSIAVCNTEDMVRQYRNHPSVILWGVRINESQDDDELYKRTNETAHRLDPTRSTGGVRYLKKSSLLEDVYTYNDFSHTGDNPGLKKKKAISSVPHAPYLVTEYNGHMYPTKAFDDEPHRLEHALRHTRVLDAMYRGDGISGCFGWCAFDYNTHSDFGSGDRICYHGVMDMFRNPKLAAAVYASQSGNLPVFSVSSSMDIGEYPAGSIGAIYAFTNADSVKLYKNDTFIGEFYPAKDRFPGLPHPPVVIDDQFGRLLEEKEGYSRKKAEGVKACLLAVARYGQENLPLRYKLRMAWLMLFHHLTMADGARLFGEYLGGWGGKATVRRFEAISGGRVVGTILLSPASAVELRVLVSSSVLRETDTYDAALVRISAVDQSGNLLPYFQEPVTLQVSGCIELIGPDVVSLKGGACGTYVKSTGVPGEGMLTISNPQAGEVTIRFQCEVEELRG